MIIKVVGEQQKKAAIQMISSLHFDPVMQVEVREWKENRSLAQLRLYWMWVTQYAADQGLTKEEAHHFFKEKLLLPIYCRDKPDYNELIESVRKVWRTGEKVMACQMKDAIVDLTSTRDADVDQFSEYLDDMDKFCLSNQIYLSRPEDMYREAMNKD